MPSFMSRCWMERNMALNVDLKLNENCFSSFKTFRLLSLQAIAQDSCSSIFTSALASRILEALGIYGQYCLMGNLKPGLQPFQLPFTSPHENWNLWLLKHWQLRKKLSFLLALAFNWEAFEVIALPQHFLSWWSGFSGSTASHQQIFNQLCIGTVHGKDFEKHLGCSGSVECLRNWPAFLMRVIVQF